MKDNTVSQAAVHSRVQLRLAIAARPATTTTTTAAELEGQGYLGQALAGPRCCLLHVEVEAARLEQRGLQDRYIAHNKPGQSKQAGTLSGQLVSTGRGVQMQAYHIC